MPSRTYTFTRIASNDTILKANKYAPQQGTIVVNEQTSLDIVLEEVLPKSVITISLTDTAMQTDAINFYINDVFVEDITFEEHKANNYNTIVVIECNIGDTFKVESIAATTSYNFDGVSYVIRSGNSQTHTITNESYTINLSTAVCCVPYYSQILYPNNITKSAEDVQIGDIIMGYNEFNNTYQEVEVLDIIHKNRTDLCKVIFEDDTYIELTTDHPILTNIGWCAYKPETSSVYESMGIIHQLESNHQVLQLDGEYKQIKELQSNILEQPIDVYTFNTTEGVDTFIAENCVVHNACDK